jgi:hypothetical protein
MSRSFRWREVRAGKIAPQDRLADEQDAARGKRRRAIAQDRPARLVAPVVQDVAQHDDVRPGWIGPGDEIRGHRGEASGQAVGLDVLARNDAHRLQVRDDASQMGMLEPDLDRLPSRAARDVHDAGVSREIETLGDELPLGTLIAFISLAKSRRRPGSA